MYGSAGLRLVVRDVQPVEQIVEIVDLQGQQRDRGRWDVSFDANIVRILDELAGRTAVAVLRCLPGRTV